MCVCACVNACVHACVCGHGCTCNHQPKVDSFPSVHPFPPSHCSSFFGSVLRWCCNTPQCKIHSPSLLTWPPPTPATPPPPPPPHPQHTHTPIIPPYSPEVGPSFSALVHKLRGCFGHKFLEMSMLQHCPDLLVCVLLKGVQVHPQRPGKQHRVLQSRPEVNSSMKCYCNVLPFHHKKKSLIQE